VTSYDGTFSPPSIGAASVPFPIAGRGRCEVTDAALTLHGFRTSGSEPALRVLAGALVAGGAALVVKLFVFPTMSAEVIGSVITAGIVSGLVIRQKARHDEPLELAIPWSSIKKAERYPSSTQPNRVTILVKKGKPKGMIYFDVEGDPNRFVADLRARI
jgi:hypothetical protein